MIATRQAAAENVQLPGTPAGTGCSRASSTTSDVPSGGRPIVTGTPTASGSLMLATTVASVGPYALNIRRPGAHCATSSGGHASPPVATHSSAAVRPAGSTEASAAGVTNACVTRFSRNRSRSSSPPRTVGGATTIVAPEPTASSNSRIEASKLGDEKCRVRERGVMPNRVRSSAAKFARPRCETTTPLGMPVEPDV
ncbi:hypothetical protein RE9416_24160 [Prescottella equi]|nr:hypothetical protein RE9416_24160 [Prescottella equi]